MARQGDLLHGGLLPALIIQIDAAGQLARVQAVAVAVGIQSAACVLGVLCLAVRVLNHSAKAKPNFGLLLLLSVHHLFHDLAQFAGF